MRHCGLLFVAVFLFGLCGAARSRADNLVVNGSFESPNVGGGWSMFANGSVPGWYTTDSAGDIEIDGDIFGAPAYAGNQSLEVNAYNPEDVYQTISGLVAGQTYVLSWAYGDRPGSGDEKLQVYFTPSKDLTAATPVATDYDNLGGSNSKLLWSTNSVVVTAISTTEVLSFKGVYVDGNASYGNEVDAVSLATASAPEPSTLLLLALGLGMLGLVNTWRRRRVFPISARL